MVADRNGMRFDIREPVLSNVLSQRCKRGGIGLERHDARIRVKLLEEENRHADIAAAIENQRSIVVGPEEIRGVHEDLAEQPAQVRLAHKGDLVAEQLDRVRQDGTTEALIGADNLLLEIF